MALYECENCGGEESYFPEVFMAVNVQDQNYPYHRNKFEVKFSEIMKDVPNNKWGEPDYEIAYNRLFEWLGKTQIMWFCSKKCAIEYLNKGENE